MLYAQRNSGAKKFRDRRNDFLNNKVQTAFINYIHGNQ